MNEQQIAFARAVSELVYCNPFSPARIEAEQSALGDEYLEHGDVWHYEEGDAPNANVERLDEKLQPFVDAWLAKLLEERRPRRERELYRDVVMYSLYNRYRNRFYELIQGSDSVGRRQAPFFVDFEQDARTYLRRSAIGDVRIAFAERSPFRLEASQLFAWFFQIRRAFHLIFRHIVGSSAAAARLRAEVWRSIFTHDLRRFRSSYDRMSDFTSLVLGPSGTGKELVARAIGMSQFIPFDPKASRFEQDYVETFFPLNLSALSSTLIESELFGHARGSFTGAVADRKGWLETCPKGGCVFLDEIGDVEESVQVKLLRVLETRTFQRIGETQVRDFTGKIVAATNRDPATALTDGRMRQDFYYRLCSDIVRTPTLVEQLEGSPDELQVLITTVCRRLVGEAETKSLVAQVLDVVTRQLGLDYPWPGNFRELEQCVRSVLIRGTYEPLPDGSDSDDLGGAVRSGGLTAEELLNRYCALVYDQVGTYTGTAARVGLDRRTVKARVEASRNPAGST